MVGMHDCHRQSAGNSSSSGLYPYPRQSFWHSLNKMPPPFASVSPARFDVQFWRWGIAINLQLANWQSCTKFFTVYSLRDCKVLWFSPQGDSGERRTLASTVMRFRRRQQCVGQMWALQRDRTQRFYTNTIKQETVAPMESAVLLRTGENMKNNCTSTGFEINDNTWED